MEAKLIILAGKANKSEVTLKLPTTVGRSRDADLTIAHPMVSRQHCQLFEDNGVLMVRDLGSLNGTFVRRERINQAVPLRPHDEFAIGPITFRAEYEHVGDIALPPSAAPPPLASQPTKEQMPNFLAMPEQTPAAGAAPVTEPAGDAGPFIAPPPSDFGEMPDFGAWGAADSGQEPQGAEPAPPGPAVAPSAAPATAEDEPQLEFPEFAPQGQPQTAPQDQQESDFSLGPSQPRSPDVNEMLAADMGEAAATNGRPAPPAIPAAATAKNSVGDTVQIDGVAATSRVTSPPLQPTGKPSEVNEEELDDFFKGIL